MRTGGITAAAPHGAPFMAASASVYGRIQFFFFAAALAKTDGPRAMQNTKAVKTGGAKLFLPKSERAVAHFGVAKARAAEAPAAPTGGAASRQTGGKNMTRAKKVILALICAAALCCAAIGGVLLARPAAEVRAEVDDLAIASVDGQIYDINTIDEIKEMLTVTRVGADGQARPISEDEEYTLTIQYEGKEVTMVNGIFPESYFVTDEGHSSAKFTLTVKDANDETASTPVTVQWAPDTGYAKLSIVSVENAPDIYPYTGLTSLASSRYISAYLLTAEEVRDGKTTSGFSPVGAVSFSGDLGAPDDAVLGTKYEVDLEAEYTGSENVLFDTCRYTVWVTPAAPSNFRYNEDASSVHKLVNGAYAGIVAGDTIEDIVESALRFNVFYDDNLEQRTIDGTDVHIKDYEYCDEDGTVDADAEAFAWGENGYVYMKVTYEECGVTRTAVVGFQLTQSPVTPYDITAENAAAEEQPADRPYGEEQYALVYQYSRVEGEAGEGSPWTVSFANLDTSIAKITQVTKAGDDSFNDSQIIATNGGSVTLTDVGTYTISLTLQSGGYSWAGMDAATRTITYTVVIEQAELVGTEFTFGGGWTYGEEANLPAPAEIKLVSRVDEDTTVSFVPPEGATIKVRPFPCRQLHGICGSDGHGELCRRDVCKFRHERRISAKRLHHRPQGGGAARTV